MRRVLGLLLTFSLILLGILLVPRVYSQLAANAERVRMLRRQDLSGLPEAIDERAWDAGWRDLCGSGDEATSPASPGSEGSTAFSALARIDMGEYAAAKALLQRAIDSGQADEIPNARAYLAALDMDWIEAVRLYEAQPTARHQRWWGTIHYLAAQHLMFEGKAREAAESYRQADAAYGTLGPYLGLGLAECLIQAERPLEAWDAYRRALVVLPPEQALGHIGRFGALRLEALRVWHEADPANAKVAHWLDFYENQALSGTTPDETLAAEPVPMVPLALLLAEGRALLGFDYRVEDIETGPFMEVDFYVREGEGDTARYQRIRRTVLNQAPNGAFAWDTVPDGVRPVGWPELVYSSDLAALSGDKVPEGRWELCLDAGGIGTSFGLQSSTVPLPAASTVYIQGGRVLVIGEGTLSLGRTWFGLSETHPYSYVPGGGKSEVAQALNGVWEVPLGAEHVAVWLLSHQTSRGCFDSLYLFPLPDLLSGVDASGHDRLTCT